MAAIIKQEAKVRRWIASRECEFLAIKLLEKLEKISILLNTGIEGECVFFVHFIDPVFLRSLFDSTNTLQPCVMFIHVRVHGRKYSNTGHEGTQLAYKDTRLHVNTLFRTLFVLFKRKVINFMQNFFRKCRKGKQS